MLNFFLININYSILLCSIVWKWGNAFDQMEDRRLEVSLCIYIIMMLMKRWRKNRQTTAGQSIFTAYLPSSRIYFKILNAVGSALFRDSPPTIQLPFFPNNKRSALKTYRRRETYRNFPITYTTTSSKIRTTTTGIRTRGRLRPVGVSGEVLFQYFRLMRE